MLNEVVQGLAIVPIGNYADVTFGGGGHAKKIVELLTAGHLFAFDKDPNAAQIAQFFTNQSFTFTRAPFRFVKEFLNFYGVITLDGLLADLGTSSYQIDTPERGFSTRFDSKLDMRMDPKSPRTAEAILHSYTEGQLAQLLYVYGEVAQAAPIAKAIVKARSYTPIVTTYQLKTIVEPFAPKTKKDQYFAKIFQSFRIEVNNELTELKNLLNQSIDIIKPQGRIAIIAYHSLEDRLVKNFLNTGNVLGKIERDAYGKLLRPFIPLQKKAFMPSIEEIHSNRRSRSARLRIGIRVG
ncbi:16S rRNA (cytosine(1402)-N(4))-methyltransferase RsmH [Candidatus Cardinium hertigii]|jgi:16S rRNA (cytosine1402-N4)-methyltransferase|uniref:Ribosomal RNA small subunit methyltransferase H n=2 Tax=Candidatus Cardinium hertigii TaxID=247481 RepID=A0A3N2QAT9_9BACT|nr:16S rRNA (cytosine(1402)-N(4))-methyltransferase RsmH [Candidatus Cardinium hertigii]